MGKIAYRGYPVAFISQNSATLALLIIFVMLGSYVWTNRRNRKVAVALTLVVLAIGAGYFSARHGPSEAATIAEVDALLGSGQPVVLEVYSDGCAVCLISKHSVDAMEKRLEGEVEVVRLDVQDEGWTGRRRTLPRRRNAHVHRIRSRRQRAFPVFGVP